jgi:hypothetical protein
MQLPLMRGLNGFDRSLLRTFFVPPATRLQALRDRVPADGALFAKASSWRTDTRAAAFRGNLKN